MLEWMWLAVIFMVVAGTLYVLLGRGRRQDDRLQARLHGVKDDPRGDADPPLVLGPITPALAGQIPTSQETRAELQKDLNAAGFYRRTAVIEYMALRAVLTLVPLFAAGWIALAVERRAMWPVLLAGLILSVLGFSLPRVFLYFRAKSRSRQIERALPIAVDLLTLCLSAGQNILGALQRVSTDLKYSYPVLAAELAIVHQQAALRSATAALMQWPERVQVPEIRNLALILTQSERLGTDASAALLEFADNFRINLRQRAETQANRTSFWMIFPTVSCLFVAAVIILVGPAYLDFWKQQIDAREMLRNDAKNVGRANNRQRPVRTARTTRTRTRRPTTTTPEESGTLSVFGNPFSRSVGNPSSK